jgi:hypothetical protein
LFVGGNATFGGGSTIGLLTAGEIVISGNFSQDGTNSATSYAPSGSHRTSVGSAAATVLAFNSLGAGVSGSHFALLNVSNATGGVTLGSNVLVENTLESNIATARIVGGGNSVTSKAWSVSGLTVDNAPMILDDLGSAALAIFDNVTFQNFPQNGVTQLRLNVAGSSLTVRPITFNNTVFSHLTGGTSLYVNATNSAIGGYVLTLQGSSEGAVAGGNGPSFSTFSGGATLSWP